MNDRYLYRAKSIKTNKWVIGHLVSRIDEDEEEQPCESFYIFKALKEEHPNTPFDMIQIDPKTIGQCTGQLDKNGKLIYEGDIIKYRQLIFNKALIDQEFILQIKVINFDEKRNGYNFAGIRAGEFDIEIIGNIHENPELMEVIE